MKLRQLSLLTLARDRENLTYEALQKALDLKAARDVEDLVISAVYAGLLHATLDPARQAVHVSSVAPLRDLSPGAIPDMLTALKSWGDRCTSTLTNLETQVKEIRATAVARQREQRSADEKLQKLVSESSDRAGPRGGASVRDVREALARRGYNKRSVIDVANLVDNEIMDLDDPDDPRRVAKRKL